MTNENDSNDRTAGPQDQLPCRSSLTPPTPAQGEVGPESSSGLNTWQETSGELARGFPWMGFTSLIISGALAIIGVIALCIYHRQLNALIESNEINHESLYAVQRAFIAFDGIGQQVVHLTAPKTKDTKGKAFQLNAKWQNVGNTPAIDVVAVFGVAEQQRDEPTEEMFIGAGRELPMWSAAVGPKSPLSSHDLYEPMSFANHTGQDGRYLWGWVFYRDTFPNTKPHVTEFCNHVEVVEKAKGTDAYLFTASYCRRHNCVDDVCEDYGTVVKMVEEGSRH